MKRFIKRMNRGIVLAVILVVVMTVYIIVDLNHFKSEKPDIEKVVTDFVSGLDEFSQAPEEYRFNSATYEGSAKDDFVKSYNSYIDKFWATDDEEDINSYNWAQRKSDMKSAVYDYIDSLRNFNPTKCSYEMNGCESISKDGPNRAKVTGTFYVNVEGTSDSVYIAPDGTESFIWDDGTGNYKNKLMGINTEMYIELVLKRTSDGWKIVSVESYGWSGGEPYVVSGSDSEKQ